MRSRCARVSDEVAAMARLYPSGTLVKWRFGTGKTKGTPYEFPADAENPWRVHVLVDATNEVVVFKLCEFTKIPGVAADNDDWD